MVSRGMNPAPRLFHTASGERRLLMETNTPAAEPSQFRYLANHSCVTCVAFALIENVSVKKCEMEPDAAADAAAAVGEYMKALMTSFLIRYVVQSL